MRDGTAFSIQQPGQLAVSPGNADRFIVAREGNDFLNLPINDVQVVTVSPTDIVLPTGWEAITEQATSVDQLSQQISNLGQIGWFYRGESQWFPHRRSSLGRYLASNAPSPIEAECSEIAWFINRAHSWLTEPERDMVRDDIVAWLTLMQHHFAPTRLLDWTYSPWVAAYHTATYERDRSGLIWAFSPSSHVRTRPSEWTAFQSKFESIKKPSEYGELLRKLPSELILPFRLLQSTERMVAQQGTFTIGHPPTLDHTALIGRYIEPGQAKVLVIPNLLKRDLLERMRAMNLTAASLFPGLDGVGRTTQETMRIAIATPLSGI